MKHWLDLTDDERNAMTQQERDECLRLTMEHELELMELVQAGLWVRTPYQTIYKLPNCHDFGVEP